MEETSNIVNKQSSASIGYIGSVEVSLVRGNKVLKTIHTHNSGKIKLFSFLANSLIGRFDTRGVPKYVMLGNTPDGTDSSAVQVSTNATPYSSVSVAVDSGAFASAIFKFLIPFSSVSNGLQINCIRLYSQNSLSWLDNIAYFILDEPLVSDGKSNILITWTMKVTNQEGE